MNDTLSYLNNRYVEELARFDHFENKCSKFITSVTLILAAITALSGMKDGVIFQLKSGLDVAIFILFLLGAFSTVCCWGHSLMALRIGDSTILPRGRDTAEYLLTATPEQVSQYLYQCYLDTLEKLEEEINEKARNLEIAYNELVISAWLLGITAIFIVIKEVSE